MATLIDILLISFAAIFKAVADTLAWHFDTSIFRNMNRDFWEVNTARIRKVKKIVGYPVDGWHLSNSLMLLCLLLLPLFWHPLFNQQIVDVGFLGVIFIVVFNLFFNKLLR